MGDVERLLDGEDLNHNLGGSVRHHGDICLHLHLDCASTRM